MAGPIKIAILADGSSATKTLKAVGDQAEQMGAAVDRGGQDAGGAMDRVGQAAVGMNAAVETASSALSAIDAIQSAAANEANRLARAQAGVEQASLDGEQAIVDLRQATEDLNQAQIDGQQGALDVEQARIDQTQADLDAATALKDYAAAVKESGAGSIEAKQAAIDLAQAKADSKQASLDLTQATADSRQAQLDETQAKVDGKQATRDAADAQLDLVEAQRQVDPTPVQQAMNAAALYGPVIASAAVLTQAFAGTQVAARVASVASTAATTAMTAAQWLLNAALTANPIGLVVVGLGLLIGAVIVAYKRSEVFRRIVDAAFKGVLRAAQAAWTWVQANWPLLLAIITGPIGLAVRFVVTHIDTIKAKFAAVPGAIRSAFAGAGSWLADAGRRIIDGLIGSVQHGFDRVRRKFEELTNLIPDWKGPASRDRDLLKRPADLIMGGFEDRLTSRFGGIRSALGGFTSSLAGEAASSIPTSGSTAGAAGAGAGGTLRLESSGSSSGVGALLVALITEEARKQGGLRVKVLPA